jgi:hypothetical protein
MVPKHVLLHRLETQRIFAKLIDFVVPTRTALSYINSFMKEKWPILHRKGFLDHTSSWDDIVKWAFPGQKELLLDPTFTDVNASSREEYFNLLAAVIKGTKKVNSYLIARQIFDEANRQTKAALPYLAYHGVSSAGFKLRHITSSSEDRKDLHVNNYAWYLTCCRAEAGRWALQDSSLSQTPEVGEFDFPEHIRSPLLGAETFMTFDEARDYICGCRRIGGVSLPPCLRPILASPVMMNAKELRNGTAKYPIFGWHQIALVGKDPTSPEDSAVKVLKQLNRFKRIVPISDVE